MLQNNNITLIEGQKNKIHKKMCCKEMLMLEFNKNHPVRVIYES